MFKEIRKSEKKLSNDEMLDIMNKAEYGVLSTIGEDGFPYGVPVNFVFKNNNIYFHCALKGHKLDNIKYSNKASFCVISDVELIPDEFNTKFKSVIAFGEVVEMPIEEKEEIFKLIIEKFAKDYMESGLKYIKKEEKGAKVFKMQVMHITAKGKK